MNQNANDANKQRRRKRPRPADFSTDRPIQTPQQDLLGRTAFAKSVAKALGSWRGKESLVVAIYGRWGSGKSSIKNLVVNELRKGKHPPHLVEFNPWNWSGDQDRVMGAFFQEIGFTLGKAPDGKKLGEKWRKYASYLTLGGRVAGGLKTVLSPLPFAPTVLGALETAASGAARLYEGGAKAAEASAESLEELKASLSKSLAALASPILVVMDDVDRLTEVEIRVLFQIVKSNADFPQLVYLLLFDRKIVENALQTVAGGDGRGYLEKIVQVGFDIPAVPQADVDKVFFDELNRLLDFKDVERTFDRDRWYHVYSKGIRPFIKSVRDVRRVTSNLSFSLALFHQKGTFEVNVVDLVAIETLRVFEPEVYYQLPHEENALLDNELTFSSPEKMDAIRAERFENIVKRARLERQEIVRELLKILFPQVVFGRGSGDTGEWAKELRICDDDFFPRYFRFAIPEGDVPQSLIDELIEIAKNGYAGLTAAFQKLHDKELLVAVLKRFETLKTELELSFAENFITALLDIGDNLPVEEEGGLFGLDAGMTVLRIIYHWLMTETDIKKRGRILLGALRNTTGFYLPVRQMSLESDRRNPEYRNAALLDDEDVQAGISLALGVITTASKNLALVVPRLPFLLWHWKDWAEDEAPRQFVTQLLSTQEGALDFLQSMTSQIRTMSTYKARVHWEVNLKSLEAFVDLGELKSAIGDALEGNSGLAVKYSSGIAAFKKALDRRARGLPDERSPRERHEDNEIK